MSVEHSARISIDFNCITMISYRLLYSIRLKCSKNCMHLYTNVYMLQFQWFTTKTECRKFFSNFNIIFSLFYSITKLKTRSYDNNHYSNIFFIRLTVWKEFYQVTIYCFAYCLTVWQMKRHRGDRKMSSFSWLAQLTIVRMVRVFSHVT